MENKIRQSRDRLIAQNIATTHEPRTSTTPPGPHTLTPLVPSDVYASDLFLLKSVSTPYVSYGIRRLKR